MSEEIHTKIKIAILLSALILVPALYSIAALIGACTFGHYNPDLRKSIGLTLAIIAAVETFILEYFKTYRRVPGRVKWVKLFLYALIASLIVYIFMYYVPGLISCPL